MGRVYLFGAHYEFSKIHKNETSISNLNETIIRKNEGKRPGSTIKAHTSRKMKTVS